MKMPFASSDKSKIILVLLVVVLGGLSVFFYYQLQNKSGRSEAAKVLSTISKFIDLPQEVPTFATVKDKTKLPKEPFYARAENGDNVLIYTQAKKAILYRPSTGRIIEFVTISVTDQPQDGVEQQPQATQSAQITQSVSPTPSIVKLALFNTTDISGLTKTIESKLSKETSVNFEVVKRGDADGTYKKTLVVDLKGAFAKEAEDIAKSLGGEVGPYPAQEESVAADVAIFIVQ